MDQFSNESAGELKKQLLEMFPQQQHNLIVTFTNPNSAIFVGSDGFDKQYFTVVQPKWDDQKKFWHIDKYELTDEQKGNIIKLLCKFISRKKGVRYTLKEIIRSGNFVLSSVWRKNTGERSVIQKEEKRIIIRQKGDSTELINIPCANHVVYNVLNSFLFLGRPNFETNFHNVLALSGDYTTHVFSYLFWHNAIEVRAHGAGIFDTYTYRLEIEEAKKLLLNEQWGFTMHPAFKIDPPGSSTQLEFGFWCGVCTMVFLERMLVDIDKGKSWLSGISKEKS